MASDPDIRRRLKAARALAGFSRVEDLAKEIGEEGLGAKALGSLERGDRQTPPQPHELAAIATACKLPYEFFTVNFARLPELTELTEVGGGSTLTLREYIDKQQRDFAAISEAVQQMATELEALRGRGATDPADHTEALTRAIEDEAPPRDESETTGRGSEQPSDATPEAPDRSRARGTRQA